MCSYYISYCAVMLLFIVIAMELRIIETIFKAISICSGSPPDQYPVFTNCSIINIFIQGIENVGTHRVILCVMQGHTVCDAGSYCV